MTDYGLPISRLSTRDLDWLQRLSRGARCKDLHRSSGYVKVRLSQVREFLDARTNAHAVAEAMRKGVIK